MPLFKDVKPEAAGVCLGGEVPLYYRTLKKGDEILGKHGGSTR